jgi:hypothetical protein
MPLPPKVEYLCQRCREIYEEHGGPHELCRECDQFEREHATARGERIVQPVHTVKQ